jgi:hypothetical protein
VRGTLSILKDVEQDGRKSRIYAATRYQEITEQRFTTDVRSTGPEALKNPPITSTTETSRPLPPILQEWLPEAWKDMKNDPSKMESKRIVQRKNATQSFSYR